MRSAAHGLADCSSLDLYGAARSFSNISLQSCNTSQRATADSTYLFTITYPASTKAPVWTSSHALQHYLKTDYPGQQSLAKIIGVERAVLPSIDMTTVLTTTTESSKPNVSQKTMASTLRTTPRTPELITATLSSHEVPTSYHFGPAITAPPLPTPEPTGGLSPGSRDTVIATTTIGTS